MTLKKIYYTLIFVGLVMTASMSIQTIIDLTGQKKENLETVSQLNEKVAHLEKDLSYYKKETEKINFYQFKENVFQLKYPKFSNIARTVFKKSKEYGFSPYLTMALIQVESNFEPYAVSTAGAYGLMQVNYSVWKNNLNIDFDRIYEHEYNIDLGLKVLKHYYDEASGNLFTALFRYNNGYKYNNTRYNGKIAATKFYAHDNGKKATKVPNKDKNLSI